MIIHGVFSMAKVYNFRQFPDAMHCLKDHED